jgi:hypothetical protein
MSTRFPSRFPLGLLPSIGDVAYQVPGMPAEPRPSPSWDGAAKPIALTVGAGLKRARTRVALFTRTTYESDIPTAPLEAA